MEDWWELVFSNLSSPKDFRSLGLTCKTALKKLKKYKYELIKKIKFDTLLQNTIYIRSTLVLDRKDDTSGFVFGLNSYLNRLREHMANEIRFPVSCDTPGWFEGLYVRPHFTVYFPKGIPTKEIGRDCVQILERWCSDNPDICKTTFDKGINSVLVAKVTDTDIYVRG